MDMSQKRIVFSDNITKLKPHYVYCHFTIDSYLPFYVGIGTNNINKTYARAKSTTGRNKYWKEVVQESHKIVSIVDLCGH